ncbi:MAG: DNA-directed RNA polymerase subunit beta [Armatimonadota bacterium]
MEFNLTENNRISFGKIKKVMDVPNLIEHLFDSYHWFLKEGIREVFDEISPIEDFTGNLTLSFTEYSFGEPPYSVEECRTRDATYSVPLKVKVRLLAKVEGEIVDIKEQEIFMGDIPYITPKGTFLVNGAERVVVSQLVRSPGVYFQESIDPTGKKLASAQIIPNRGAWLEFEIDSNDILGVRIDKTRKIPVTILLKALGYAKDKDILKLFKDSPIIKNTLLKDGIDGEENALIEIYRRLRPGDPPTVDSARNLIANLFFNNKRYDLAKVGRYKINKKLGIKVACKKCGSLRKVGTINCPDCSMPLDYERTIDKKDIVAVIKYMLDLADGIGTADDIDHLGNRRIRAVGELLQNQFRVGMLRLERVVRERMTVQDPQTVTPQVLVNIRPVVAAIKEFFGSSQLSQFMDQTNAVAELTHKRRISALGPGGLSRERAGFEVRDVHYSHYGRICPIETPEGPNIGLIGTLTTYAKINEFGFINTPYRKVKNGVVTNEIEYLCADEEDDHVIAQANTLVDKNNRIVREKVVVRAKHETQMKPREEVDFMDVSPRQIVSVCTTLIPFLEHDDANRALMGANMQRQAVPLIAPQAPLVGTGVEYRAAKDSGLLVTAEEDGEVTKADADRIIIEEKNGKEKEYELLKYKRSNAATCVSQRPVVHSGDKIKAGQVIADAASSVNGELALGRNILVAFMPWEGYNYEDAILISEELVKEDVYTSVHIEEYDCEARDTKLGPEEITRDIPNVGDEALKELDESGIIRIGADVGPEDILVGKVTPKGETELTAEERLLRAIFGEKARDVRDTSLRAPHGECGKVIDVKVLSRDAGDELSPGINKLVKVYIAQKRKIMQGDKMAGRHGNKGVIAKILPAEDMPYLPDGTPVQIVLNPLSVPSRMNIGQVLETHLGLAAHFLGMNVECPVYDSATENEIRYYINATELKRFLDSKGINITYEEAFEVISKSTLQLRLTEYLEKREIILPLTVDALLKKEDWEERLIDICKVKNISLPKSDLRDIMTMRPFTFHIKELIDKKGYNISAIQLKNLFDEIEEKKILAGDGKSILYDGRSGIPFDNRVTVGYIYMMKLAHLVDDKIHARSTGPYSLITQQPLGGKAQFGGQRFGEMEVWALEAYGASYTLQELLTLKSDDVVGRVKAYESIVKGENILEPGVPESFKVLIKELQSLCLNIKILSKDEEEIEIQAVDEDIKATAKELGLDIGSDEMISL